MILIMTSDKKIIYFITTNVHKFNEIFDMFKRKDLKYSLKQNKSETTEIQADSLKDVALFKLKSVKHKIKSSFFVEDSGFFIDVPLNGFPGVFSSYVLNTIGNKGILKLIDDFNTSRAHFSTEVALYFKPFDKILFFNGNVAGKISKTIRGKGGFGFDPIFIPDLLPNKTFAELSTSEKNSISHRSQATNKLLRFLESN